MSTQNFSNFHRHTMVVAGLAVTQRAIEQEGVTLAELGVWARLRKL